MSSCRDDDGAGLASKDINCQLATLDLGRVIELKLTAAHFPSVKESAGPELGCSGLEHHQTKAEKVHRATRSAG